MGCMACGGAGFGWSTRGAGPGGNTGAVVCGGRLQVGWSPAGGTEALPADGHGPVEITSDAGCAAQPGPTWLGKQRVNVPGGHAWYPSLHPTPSFRRSQFSSWAGAGATNKAIAAQMGQHPCVLMVSSLARSIRC